MLGMGIAWPLHFFVTCYTGVAVTVLIVMLYRLLREVPESKWLLNSVLGMHGVNVGKIKQVLEDQKTLLNTPNPKDMSSDIQDRMNQIGRARTQLKAGYSQGRLRRAMLTASARSKLPQR